MSAPQQHDSPWPHRLAVLLVCATFPLIWVGGLVTSYKAGMAVPDWPNTYGYNLFLYPWQTWLFGPWDILVEHGHRLLGAAVGLVAIATLVVCRRSESRRWVVALALMVLAAVIVQGVLGGLRVLLDRTTLAKIHGCTGPLFFALAVSLAAVTSNRWKAVSARQSSQTGIFSLALVTTVLAYLQIVLGAQLRHIGLADDIGYFRIMLWFHLITAASLLVHQSLLLRRVWRGRESLAWLVRPAQGLSLLVLVQLVLGAATWIVKYGWPVWFRSWDSAQAFLVQQESILQASIVTAHVATGSLILVTSLLIALRAGRLTLSPPRWSLSRPLSLGVAL